MSEFSAPGASDPLIGSSVVGYLVKGRLGSGGMGVVYEGEQTTIGKRVAIKVLRSEVSEDPTTVQRLVSEARAVNAVGHRGIIDVFAYGQMPDGRHAIVMELLDGEPLDEVLEAHRASGQLMALPDTLLILQETLAALHAAHSAGVIHRDLKPSNIFLCRQRDGSRFVKILDFGIAKLGVSQNVSAQASMLVGTPSYMAPEQASGGKVGPALDMYAVGVMSFEMLTGQLPFTGDSVMEVLMAHANKPPPDLQTLNPAVPDALNALVHFMLSKRPDQRPASAQLVADEIENIRYQLLEAQSQSAASIRRLGFSRELDVVVTARRNSKSEMPAVATPTNFGDDANALGVEKTHASNPRLKAIVETPYDRVSPTGSGPLQKAAAPSAAQVSAVIPPAKSKTPLVVLGVAVLVAGVAGFALLKGEAPAPVPPPVKPPAVVEQKPEPTPAPAVPAVAPPQPEAVKPETPKPAEPAVVEAKPAEPKVAPAVTPVVAKPNAQAQWQKRLAALEKRLAAAEADGSEVSVFKATVAKIRARSQGTLDDEQRTSLDLALKRLEESTDY